MAGREGALIDGEPLCNLDNICQADITYHLKFDPFVVVTTMARFRLKPPHPYAPGQSRPILSVKYEGKLQGYATFKDGSYVFDISDPLYDRMVCDEAEATFEMQGDVPVAILIRETHED